MCTFRYLHHFCFLTGWKLSLKISPVYCDSVDSYSKMIKPSTVMSWNCIFVFICSNWTQHIKWSDVFFFIYQNYKIKYITWFKLCHIVLNRSNTVPSAELSFPACVCLFLRYLCSPTGLMVMLTSLQIRVPSPHLLMFSGCMRTRGTALPGTGKHTHVGTMQVFPSACLE